MGNSSSVPWWSAIGRGRRDPAPDTDYADMGTAFGLDAALAAPDEDGEPRAGDPAPGADAPRGHAR